MIIDSGRSIEQNKAQHSVGEYGHLKLQLSVRLVANGLQQLITTTLGANFQASILTNKGDIPLSLPWETPAQQFTQ